MSVSCVGTCSACGVRRLWISDTFSLQLDDGSLKCLPHPGERGACEREGLTLAQASRRGRLYRETFYVCHHCGRMGEFIEQRPGFAEHDVQAISVRSAAKLSVALLVIPLPLALWYRWWDGVMLVGIMAVVLPVTAWRDHRKQAAALKARGLPRPGAPGEVPVAPPTRGCIDGIVIGHKLPGWDRGPIATGPCCDRPNWKWAGSQRDADQIPCCACGRGVMTVSEPCIS